MTKEIWLNLPVKNIQQSVDFFKALGFSFNAEPEESAICACMLMGEKNTAVMLFEKNVFKNFSQHPLTDTTKSSEILISFDAQSIEEVNEMAAKAEKAGANVFGKPTAIQDWMYGFAFADPDGHRWNMVYMDKSKMPQDCKV